MRDSLSPDPGVADPTANTAAPEIVPPDDHPATMVELWTPRGIGWASVLLGFPGATVLAALNWRRMDQTRKAIVHLVVAVAGTAVLFLPKVGSIGLLVGIVVGYYLYRVQRSDQSSFARADLVAERNGLLGAVIAIVFTVAIVGLGVAVAVVAGGSEATNRGHVLFGTAPGTDVCSPTGQKGVFGPADPIFVAAVMRETVQTGSHVVYEVDSPGATAGPFPVTLTPPYDCLGATQPIGPLDPGNYVVRYRYDGRPATPDLATGTFTVTAGSAPSASSASELATTATSGSPSPSLASPQASSPAPAPSVSAICSSPASGGYPHQAPEIETLLPASVAGRPLTRWSVRGRCWLDEVFTIPATIDPFVAKFRTPNNPNPIDDKNLVYGVAGRSTRTDPPFFVFAALRPANNDEIGLVLDLFFGGASFHDAARAPDLTNYQPHTIAGKQVYVGTADMLTQDTHQRGRPYLYQTDQYLFLVITDEDAWAAEAISKLP